MRPNQQSTRGRNRLAALTAASLVAVSLVSCSSSGDSSNAPGVTDKSITLGALSALTGNFAAGAKRQLAGAQLYWKQVNDAGGICDGRKVKIVARDNGYDPQKTTTAYNDISGSVLAIQLITGTAMTQAIAPKMAASNVSAVPMSWSPDLLGAPAILIPGSTYDVDMANAMDYLAQQKVLAPGATVAYLYFQGDFGGAGLAGAQAAAKKLGVTVDAQQVDPTTTDLTPQMSKIRKIGAKAIFMSTSPPLFANAAAVAATAGLSVPFVLPTPTFVPELLKSEAAKQVAANTYVFSPYNAWSAKDAAMGDLRTLFAKDGDQGSVQQFLVAGYSAAQLMDTALRATCKDGSLTRAALKKQFEAVKSFDMNGLSVNLDYRNRSTAPSMQDYVLKVDPSADGGLTPVQDDPYQGPNTQAAIASK